MPSPVGAPPARPSPSQALAEEVSAAGATKGNPCRGCGRRVGQGRAAASCWAAGERGGLGDQGCSGYLRRAGPVRREGSRGPLCGARTWPAPGRSRGGTARPPGPASGGRRQRRPPTAAACCPAAAPASAGLGWAGPGSGRLGSAPLLPRPRCSAPSFPSARLLPLRWPTNTHRARPLSPIIG